MMQLLEPRTRNSELGTKDLHAQMPQHLSMQVDRNLSIRRKVPTDKEIADTISM